MRIEGEMIALRSPVLDDASLLQRWENHPEIARVSGWDVNYSLEDIKRYLNSIKDVHLDGQMRMVIVKHNNESIGTVDLFDVDMDNGVACIGILIAEEASRRKGYGKEAVHLICGHAFSDLNLKCIYADVQVQNKPSKAFFESIGFVEYANSEGVLKYQLKKDE